jgi:hypothetical protein
MSGTTAIFERDPCARAWARLATTTAVSYTVSGHTFAMTVIWSSAASLSKYAGSMCAWWWAIVVADAKAEADADAKADAEACLLACLLVGLSRYQFYM